MKKKALLFLLSPFTLLILGGFLVADNPKIRPVVHPPVVNAQEESGLVNLSGTGQEATEQFNLEGGLTVFSMNHTGGSNFIVELLDENGNTVELLVNEIGSFDGKKAIGLESGEYLLDITAGGSWTVEIEQPNPEEAPSVPQEFSGSGQDVTEIFSIGEGLARFEMTHAGSGNFIVTLLDDRGGTIDLLVNEIGSFDGSNAVNINNTGMYILDVRADGEWSINVTGEEPAEEEVQRSVDREDDSSDVEGCFVATAVYGTPSASDIDTLRSFRDETLATNSIGKKFIEFYYEYGPFAAEFISDKPITKTLIRETLIKPSVDVLEYAN